MPFSVIVLPGIPRHVVSKLIIAPSPALASIVAVHVSSVGIAVMPPMTGGWHVDVGSVSVGVGVGALPLGQVLTATVQAELTILFVLSTVALELELLSAVFVFMFVFVLLAEAFCIIGNIPAPKTSIDAIAATIMIPLIVWFILSFTSI